MIVAGFGFREAAKVESLQDALSRACAGHAAPDLLATPEDKAATQVFQGFARDIALPVNPVTAPQIAAQQVQTQSAQSTAHRGTGSVAEAAALAAAGPNARLLGARCISQDRMATCALAQGEPS